MDKFYAPKSIYIHIPFCQKRCNYCSFLSGFDLNLMNDYVVAVIKEAKRFYENQSVKTLYFGGGTPSLLTIKHLENIINTFNFEREYELTLEVNPKTVDLKKLKEFKKIGINRISLGVQSFDDDILKFIGRVHNSKEALETIENIKLSGFENFSIDLMYGLPNQTLKIWEKTLNVAKTTGAKHISLYGLKIEEGTNFYKNPPKNLPDEDLAADMYELALNNFSNFYHYEFSNFALCEKYLSKHNLTYWKTLPYLGLGLGASGFLYGKRYQNETDFCEYLKNPTAEKNFEQYSEKKLLEEHIFLAFRLFEGIDVEKINVLFNINFDIKYEKQLKKFIELDLIQKTLHGYRLTKKGILLSNSVLCEFLD